MNPPVDSAVGEAPPFDGQPCFGERLRLVYQPQSVLPDQQRLDALDTEARVVLTRLLALEDSITARSEDEHEAHPDLIRLERKLDLVLELLSLRLLENSSAQERWVWISASGACWEDDAGLGAAGSPGLLSIHLHRLLPRPLQLAVRVQDAGAGRAQVEFLQLGEECTELLVRYVFLQHRRGLAGHRRQRRSG